MGIRRILGSSLSLLLLVVAGCKSLEQRSLGGAAAVSPSASEEVTTLRTRLPWELFEKSKDAQGMSLRRASLIEGDEAAFAGDRVRALGLYQAALTEKLSEAEQLSAIERVAATELSLDRAKKSITTLTDFFRKSKISEKDVPPRFSVLFGYAYGRTGNYDQSLAWFSKARRDVNVPVYVTSPARLGVQFVARNLSNEELASIATKWRADEFISSALGEERAKRFSGTQPIGNSYDIAYAAVQNEQRTVQQAGQLGRSVVFALELSGKFKSLGKSTKQGAEMAARGVGLAAPDGKEDLTVSFVDAADAAAIETLGAGVAPTVLVGPLMNETTKSIEPLVNQVRAPYITLARNADVFSSTVKFAPTIGQQVESLFNAVASKNLKRFAIIGTTSDSWRDIAQAGRVQIGAQGGSIVFEREYNRGDELAMIGIGKELEEVAVDAVLFADDVKHAAKFFGDINPLIRERLVILGSASWGEKEIQRSISVLEGAVWPAPFIVSSPRPVVQEFVDSYRATYQVEPDFLAAQGFDVGTLVLNALKSQIIEGGTFLKALAAIGSYHGLTGTFSVREDGTLDRQYEVYTVREGAIVPLE